MGGMPPQQQTDEGVGAGKEAEYLSFLSRAVQEIGSSLDYEKTLSNVAHAMVPALSDWCAVDIVQEDGKLKRLATAHIDGEMVEKALELGRKYPRDPEASSGSSFVLKTGEPNMFNNIADEQLVAEAINEEHLEMMRELQFRSLMIVPIKSRGRTLGTITLVWSDPRKAYNLLDLAFAETLAAVAGTAIDNSQLYRESQRKSRAKKTTQPAKKSGKK